VKNSGRVDVSSDANPLPWNDIRAQLGGKVRSPLRASWPTLTMWVHERVKPIAKTDRCEVHHVGYVVQGRMKIVGRDGSEDEIKAGDGFVIPPGHDAWTVGNETVILLDFKGSPEYAKQK
jgi:uncharacterized cupin superfamily protein